MVREPVLHTIALIRSRTVVHWNVFSFNFFSPFFSSKLIAPRPLNLVRNLIFVLLCEHPYHHNTSK